jgi:hypothetical protein
MAELAQTYIHLRPYEITRRRLDELGDYVQEIARNAARDVYGGNVTIDVKLEGGSLKVWVTVGGIINGLYIGYGIVADYKGFKEGIVDLCSEARAFGTDVCGAFTQKAGAPKRQIYRVEKRLKAPGKINRLIKKLESLDRMADRLSNAEMRRQLDSVKRDLELLEKDMTSEEIERLQKTLEFKNLPPLKDLPERRQARDMPKAALRVQDIQPKMFVPSTGTSLVTSHVVHFPPEQPLQLTYNKRLFVPPV